MQNQFCDGYSVSFSTFDEMRAYHEALSRESLWLHCSVSELRVMPVTSESAPWYGYAPCVSEDAVADTAQNLGLAVRVCGEAYPLRQTAWKSLLDRAKLSGSVLPKLSREKLADILNECFKLHGSDALALVRCEKVSALHSGDEADYSVLPIDELLGVISESFDERFPGSVFARGYTDHALTSAEWTMPAQRDELLKTYEAMLVSQGKGAMAARLMPGIYYYTDRDGKQQQKWEPPVSTKKEATRRKNQIEYQIDNGTFIPPSNVTVEDFLNDFVELYGSKKWGLSAWTSNTGLIRNYILPLLAGKCVQDITPRTVDLFIHELQGTKPVESFRKSKQEFVTACTIEKIVKLMRTAFRQAVRWGLIGSNPFDNAVLPKREKKERAIWDVKTIRKALDECKDGRLFIALNLAFACSMRLGEITGLQWDCVDISDRAIANDDASIRIERELERVDQEAINALGNADIIMVFPGLWPKNQKPGSYLKSPKRTQV